MPRLNATNPQTVARYVARLVALLITANVALLVRDPRFATLSSQPALIADLILVGTWLVIVLTAFADTGDVPDVPPVLQERIGVLEAENRRLAAQMSALGVSVSAIATAPRPGPGPLPPPVEPPLPGVGSGVVTNPAQ